MNDVLLVIASLLVGGAVTYFVNTRYIHRPNLQFTLSPVAFLDRREYGNNHTMSLRGNAIDNVGVFSLELYLRGSSDIAEDHIPPDQKPSLRFPGFSAFDVRTLNNDESRFDVPLGLVANGSLVIINIRRIRAGTRATFQLIGTFEDPAMAADIRSYQAEFYPGAIRNVDAITIGAIKRPWRTQKR